jgi:hypothetical protein
VDVRNLAKSSSVRAIVLRIGIVFVAMGVASSGWAQKIWGYNGPWAQAHEGGASEQVHARALDLVSLAGGKIYRFDLSTDFAMDGPKLWNPRQRRVHEFIARKCAELRIRPMLILNATVPNKSEWRKAYARAKGMDANQGDRSLHGTWGQVTDSRLGVPKELWQGLIDSHNEIIRLYADTFERAGLNWADYGIIEGLNEAAWIEDAKVGSRPDIPYGSFSAWIHQFYDQAFLGTKPLQTRGATVLAGSYENQGNGRRQEIKTGEGAWKSKTAMESVHLYIGYRQGESMVNWGDRLMRELDAWLQEWDDLQPRKTNRRVAVTEFGSANMPASIRRQWLEYGARRLLRHPRCEMAVAFTTTLAGEDGRKFGVIPWEEALKPGGVRLTANKHKRGRISTKRI